MAKLADAADLKSAVLNRTWGFKSPSGHHRIRNLDRNRCSPIIKENIREPLWELTCPANSVPVELIETGMDEAWNGRSPEVSSGANRDRALANGSGDCRADLLSLAANVGRKALRGLAFNFSDVEPESHQHHRNCD